MQGVLPRAHATGAPAGTAAVVKPVSMPGSDGKARNPSLTVVAATVLEAQVDFFIVTWLIHLSCQFRLNYDLSAANAYLVRSRAATSA